MNIERFEGDAKGWYIAYVDSDKLTLTIHSDWGIWGYRWPPQGMPDEKAFLDFLFNRTHFDYLLSKLFGAGGFCVDEAKTRTALRCKVARVARRYREDTFLGDEKTNGPLDERVRDAMELIAQWEDGDHERLSALHGVFFPHGAYEYIQQCRTLESLAVQDAILPAIAAQYARQRKAAEELEEFYTKYPEHKKLKGVEDEARVLSEFIECEGLHDGAQRVADFFGIDKDAHDEEKERMYDEMRKATMSG